MTGQNEPLYCFHPKEQQKQQDVLLSSQICQYLAVNNQIQTSRQLNGIAQFSSIVSLEYMPADDSRTKIPRKSKQGLSRCHQQNVCMFSWNVFYFSLGLPSHPQHELMRRQCTGCPGMITFYIKGKLEHASAFLSNLKVMWQYVFCFVF